MTTSPRSATPGRLVRAVTVCAWLALIAFVVASLGGSLLGRETFLATDLMTGRHAPWMNAPGVGTDWTGLPLGAANPYPSDTLDQWTPAALQFGRELHEGRIQQWNPYQMGGIEGSSLPTSGVWSPLALPWLLFPGPFAPAAVKVLEVLTVTLGMSLLLRRWRLPQATWPLASLAYLSSGLMVAWTNWPQTRTAAVVPLLFWALDRAVLQRTWWNAPLVGAMFALMFLGGFPSLAIFALYAGGFFVLARMFWHRSWRDRLGAVARSLAGVVTGVAMAAFMFLPFLYNALNILDFAGREQGPDAHLSWQAMATMLVADTLGEPTGANRWSTDHPIERFSYLGIAVVLLAACAALWTRRRRAEVVPAMFAGAALAVLTTVVYVGGPLLAVAQKLPFLNSNPINRMIMLIGFFVAVLAAYGFAGIMERVAEPRGLAREPLGATVLRSLLALVVLGVPLAALAAATWYGPVREHLLRNVLPVPFGVGLLALVVVALGFLGRRRALSAVCAVALLALVAVPATAVTRAWWPRNPVESFYATTPTHAFLEENLGPDRFAHVGQTMLPGTSTVYGLRAVQGRGFMSDEWGELMLAVDPQSRLDDWYWTLSDANLATALHSGVLDRLATRYVVAPVGTALPGTVAATGEAAGTSTVQPGEELLSGVQQGPVRAIRVENTQPVLPQPGGMTATLDLVGTDGEVLATASTWVGLTWNALTFPITGEEIGPGTEWTARLRFDHLAAPFDVVADAQGDVVLAITRPVPGDGLRVVHAGDAVVLERESWLPRVRWADAELVEPDPVARVALLDDPATPHDAVVLEHEADAHGLPGTSRATVVDRSVGTDVMTIDVDADGPGWVVVADSLRRGGWSATVDGEPARIVDAEHAAGAVFVDGAGTRTVELTYRAPWLREGVVVTGATAVLLAIAGAVAVRRRRTGVR